MDSWSKQVPHQSVALPSAERRGWAKAGKGQVGCSLLLGLAKEKGTPAHALKAGVVGLAHGQDAKACQQKRSAVALVPLL